jgi:hypothetical protein
MPPKVARCIQCGMLQTGGPPRKETDAGRSGLYPTEVYIVIAVIILRVILVWSGKPMLMSALEADLWKCFLLGYSLLEGLSVSGLLRRTTLGLCLAVAVSGLLTVAFVWFRDPAPTPDPERGVSERIVLALLVSPMILLFISAGRGSYHVRRKAEPPPGSPVPPLMRKICTRCGDPCSPFDHPWTRAGFCSRRCLDNGG